MDPYTPPVQLKKRASQMITEAQERLVLLVNPEPGNFGFRIAIDSGVLCRFLSR